MYQSIFHSVLSSFDDTISNLNPYSCWLNSLMIPVFAKAAPGGKTPPLKKYIIITFNKFGFTEHGFNQFYLPSIFSFSVKIIFADVNKATAVPI